MNKEEAVIIDGNAIIWRAWYATQKQEINPEKALEAIKTTINSYLKKKPYEYGVVVFDSTKDTFRKELLPEYKSNREPMPAELFNILPEAYKTIENLGLNILSAPKPYEGDDAIATLSKIFEDHKIKADVFSTDGDMLQLVSYYTSVILLKKDQKKEYTFKNFQQENEGLMPWQIPIFKSLVGDTSDNYSGIAGIGKTTAHKILKTHPSIEDIYDNIDSLELKSDQKKKLLSQKENLLLSVEKLATTKNDIEEISADINNYRMKSHESNSRVGQSGKQISEHKA